MHTTYGRSGRTWFIHNSDARNGMVTIGRLRPGCKADLHTDEINSGDFDKLEIPYNDLLGLVSTQVRQAQIRRLEMEDVGDEETVGYPVRAREVEWAEYERWKSKAN